MAKHHACRQCGSVEWIRLEYIEVDSKDHAVQAEDVGLFKCANCGSRAVVSPEQPIETVETPSQRTASRVRSSVSAASRGLAPGSDPRKP